MNSIVSLLVIASILLGAHVRSCPDFEFYNTCAPTCGDGCDTYRLPIRCNRMCAMDDTCTCVSGYKRSPVSHRCVPEAQCPTTEEWNYATNEPVCGQNEEYKTSADCLETCDPSTYCPAARAASGPPKCWCMDACCRNATGACVERI